MGQALGAGAGYAGGTFAGTLGDLPPVVVLAASPSKLYLMTSSNDKGIILAKHLTLLDTINRDDIRVEMHQKATVRTAVITDESGVSGATFSVSGPGGQSGSTAMTGSRTCSSASPRRWTATSSSTAIACAHSAPRTAAS